MYRFQLEQFLLAALDTTINDMIDPTLLESDEHGNSDPDKIKGDTCYQLIAKNDFKVSIIASYVISILHAYRLYTINFQNLEEHESFRSLVNSKWQKYGWIWQR